MIHWELCKVQIWPYEQMVYAQHRMRPRKWATQTPLWFWNTNGSPNLSKTTRPDNNKKKKANCQIMNFDVPADQRVKLKKHKKKDKCQKQIYFMRFSLFRIVKWFQVLLNIPDNSNEDHSFIYTQLDVKKKSSFKTIQFNISTQFKCKNSSFSNNSV